MRKIITFIIASFFCIGLHGQGNEKMASNCVDDATLLADSYFSFYLDTMGVFYYGCNGSPSEGGEYIFHFTPTCTNNYTMRFYNNDGSNFFVSIKASAFTYCDSIGYSCLSPIYLGGDNYKIDLLLDSNITYDILFENSSSIGYGFTDLIIYTPHASNVQFFDITPDSISVSWDGTFDDMVIEYDPKGFVPGTDTIAGTNGILLHNPASPQTFTGLLPDSAYDFYFRDKCGVFSQNFLYSKRTARNPNTLPLAGCNSGFSFWYYGSDQNDPGAWTFNNCINATSQEYIYKFIPDTSGVDSIYHYANANSAYNLGVYYKKASLGMNEQNWICAGYGGNQPAWTFPLGPLEKDTLYYLMIKGERSVVGGIQLQIFSIYCPAAICSTAPSSVNSNATNNTICLGQALTLTEVGGTLSSSGAFHWYADSCGGTSLGTGYMPTFYPTDTTTYYVRAEDSCGVTTCASITINVNPSPAPPIITGTTAICQGNSTTLNPGLSYYCYMWSNGATTATITVSTAGTYTVTVCGANGCTSSASATVNVLPLPTAVISGTASICAGQTTNLTILFTGTAPWNYAYNTPAGIVNASSSVSPVVIPVSPSTTFNYTLVTVTNPNCVGIVSGNATITVYPLPTATIYGNATICPGNCTNLTVSFTGTSPFVYSYTEGSQTFGPFTTAANPAQINACPTYTTTYTVVSVTDANCTGIASGMAMVTVNPNPVAVITPSVTTYICLGDTVHFTANAGTGLIYQWYKNTVPISGAVNSFYDAFATGLYSFAVTDSNGCYSMSSSALVQIICFPPIEPADLRIANESNDDMVLIPNPASHEITIQTGRSIQSIKIFDVIGRQVYSQNPGTLPITIRMKPKIKINISHFSNGIYFVEVNDGKEKAVKKFVKE